METITVATEVTEGLKRLKESLATVGSALTVVGQGEQFRGFGWRFKRLVAAISQSTAEVVVHCDGYDTICLEPIESLVEKFEAEKHPIVFSSEWHAQPEPWLWLNPALMVANRAAFLEIFTEKCLEELFPDHFNDMFQLQLLFGNEPELFKVDRANNCFFTQSGPQRLEDRGKLVDPISGAEPAFVHGPQSADLSNVETWLSAVKVL